MAVDDHGIETIRKAGEEVTPGDKSDYYIKVNDDEANATLVEIKDNGVSATPSGLSTAGVITVVTLNSTGWTALPATALTDRNGIGIQNDSAIQIKLNFDNLEPGYVGWNVNANGETFVDITDAVIIYAKSQSGTPSITVMEVS